MNQAFISLGSNIDSEQNLPQAVQQLAGYGRVLAASPVYETAPVGNVNQPKFLNAAVLIETELTAADLKDALYSIEETMKRVRTADKNAPRVIDLDLSLYNDQVLEIGQRHIPDRDILAFAHVAVPLADLAPLYAHPETGDSLRSIAQRLTNRGLVRRPDVSLEPIESVFTGKS